MCKGTNGTPTPNLNDRPQHRLSRYLSYAARLPPRPLLAIRRRINHNCYLLNMDIPIKQRRPYSKTCEHCQSTFNRKEHEDASTYKTRRHCSQACKKALHKKRIINAAKAKHGQDCLNDKPCPACGKAIQYKDHMTPFEFIKKQTCSEECAVEKRIKTKRKTLANKKQSHSINPKKKIKNVDEWLQQIPHPARLKQSALCRGLIK